MQSEALADACGCLVVQTMTDPSEQSGGFFVSATQEPLQAHYSHSGHSPTGHTENEPENRSESQHEAL